MMAIIIIIIEIATSGMGTTTQEMRARNPKGS